MSARQVAKVVLFPIWGPLFYLAAMAFACLAWFAMLALLPIGLLIWALVRVGLLDESWNMRFERWQDAVDIS